ncbi:MAG: insulinase family protein [Cyclobacteriaceae bacterium]|nr:insulinase family protein [Cyclobacteriaceae bacterium]
MIITIQAQTGNTASIERLVLNNGIHVYNYPYKQYQEGELRLFIRSGINNESKADKGFSDIIPWLVILNSHKAENIAPLFPFEHPADDTHVHLVVGADFTELIIRFNKNNLDMWDAAVELSQRIANFQLTSQIPLRDQLESIKRFRPSSQLNHLIDLEEPLTENDLRRFFNRWYQPNQMGLFVFGINVNEGRKLRNLNRSIGSNKSQYDNILPRKNSVLNFRKTRFTEQKLTETRFVELQINTHYTPSSWHLSPADIHAEHYLFKILVNQYFQSNEKNAAYSLNTSDLLPHKDQLSLSDRITMHMDEKNVGQAINDYLQMLLDLELWLKETENIDQLIKYYQLMTHARSLDPLEKKANTDYWKVGLAYFSENNDHHITPQLRVNSSDVERWKTLLIDKLRRLQNSANTEVHIISNGYNKYLRRYVEQSFKNARQLNPNSSFTAKKIAIPDSVSTFNFSNHQLFHFQLKLPFGHNYLNSRDFVHGVSSYPIFADLLFDRYKVDHNTYLINDSTYLKLYSRLSPCEWILKGSFYAASEDDFLHIHEKIYDRSEWGFNPIKANNLQKIQYHELSKQLEVSIFDRLKAEVVTQNHPRFFYKNVPSNLSYRSEESTIIKLYTDALADKEVNYQFLYNPQQGTLYDSLFDWSKKTSITKRANCPSVGVSTPNGRVDRVQYDEKIRSTQGSILFNMFLDLEEEDNIIETAYYFSRLVSAAANNHAKAERLNLTMVKPQLKKLSENIFIIDFNTSGNTNAIRQLFDWIEDYIYQIQRGRSTELEELQTISYYAQSENRQSNGWDELFTTIDENHNYQEISVSRKDIRNFINSKLSLDRRITFLLLPEIERGF